MARLVLPVLLLVLLAGCSQQKSGPPAVEASLPEAILGGIRQPAPGRFPDGERVVRFLLEQVASQNETEAARAFPIVERYQKFKLADHAADLRTVTPTRTPLPGYPVHNLVETLVVYLGDFHRLSIGLLVEQPDRVRTFGEEELAKGVPQLEKELDPARLRGLQVVAVEEQPGGLPASYLERPLVKGLGVSEVKFLLAKIRLDGREREVYFIVGKLGDNWRILNVTE